MIANPVEALHRGAELTPDFRQIAINLFENLLFRRLDSLPVNETEYDEARQIDDCKQFADLHRNPPPLPDALSFSTRWAFRDRQYTMFGN
tara:strand:+ start:504 stop:773 length:270 start_codon:yes stop_codon:yes gene_type:complete